MKRWLGDSVIPQAHPVRLVVRRRGTEVVEAGTLEQPELPDGLVHVRRVEHADLGEPCDAASGHPITVRGQPVTVPEQRRAAITTVTTVGYGDRYPTTGTGRLVGGALMLVGIALLGVITASIAAWFVDRLRDVQVAETTTEAALGEVLAELKALHTRLDAIERQPRVPTASKSGTYRRQASRPRPHGIRHRMVVLAKAEVPGIRHRQT